ncbi:SMP-30/gluconolactonase/LRE family protein [Streptomyces sp. NPDC046261]|uniref:NHL domain-containing protein n=1 Tax=Streptomyces sp. NPDC046261 TaxID=3157200 RepID=UPI0033CB7FF9
MSEPDSNPGAPAPTPEPTIVTVAGYGDAVWSGDGHSAVSAGLDCPTGVAIDDLGNLYIADVATDRVRKVDAKTGTIHAFAGNGLPTFGGDDKPAVSAHLWSPSDVAVDAQGNVYIADADNHRVRKVDAATATITTVAGTGKPGHSGDDKPAVTSQLSNPRGVALDAGGNLYIADTDNQRLRRVDAKTGTITTVAGNGSQDGSGDDGPAAKAALNAPRGVAVDAQGNVYIADTGNHRVRRVDAATATITTVAGTGKPGHSGDGEPAVKAQLSSPSGVAVDSDGNLFVAEYGTNRVRRVDAVTRTIDPVAGTGHPTFSGDTGAAVRAELASPRGVAVDRQGNLYIADTGNHRVRKVTGLPSAPRFVVSPGGPPEVSLTRSGETGYPGVRLHATHQGPVPPLTVRVDLPAGKGLQFVAEGHGAFQLTVLDADGHTRSYPGTLSSDRQTLTFEEVDPGLKDKGATSAAWVAVKATGASPLGDTALTFRMGARTSSSTPVHVVVQVSVSPGGPPDVTLTHAGGTGYPGVRLYADEGAVGPQTVHVELPPDRGLRFVAEHGSRYQLTVLDAHNVSTAYDGTLSPDGQSLTFDNVDLALPAKGSASTAWVAVKAAPDAPFGTTNVTFRLAGRTSPSTSVHVVVRFSVSPGGPPPVDLTRGGGIGYPGVRLHADEGAVPSQTVRVALPPGKKLRFVAEHGSDYQLTVLDAHNVSTAYDGTLSPDGQSLTFDNVDLALPAKGSASTAWVAVQADSGAPTGDTGLTFLVGPLNSPSTPVRIR